MMIGQFRLRENTPDQTLKHLVAMVYVATCKKFVWEVE